jgi:hypothetical protein
MPDLYAEAIAWSDAFMNALVQGDYTTIRRLAPVPIRVADYILPTGSKMNPWHPEDADYYDHEQTAIILFKLNDNRSRPTRLVTGFGHPNGPPSGWEIGQTWSLRHDQTNARLGDYVVVGWRSFSTSEFEGDVPDIKMSHSVFK